jgi:hypothetical protein
MRVHELIGILAAATLVIAVAAPAAGETVERDDRQGDAPASIDVVHATYSHTHSRVRVVARLPHLGRGGAADLSISRFEVFELGYVLRITNRPGKPPRTQLLFYNHFDLVPRGCAAIAGTWTRGVIRMSVARTCLAGHAAEDVFAQFAIRHGRNTDRVPAVRRLHRS